MSKVKVSANAVLEIIQSVFNDEDVNDIIDDTTAPKNWRGKTIQEALNVEYYTFKHRPLSTEAIINEKMQEGLTVNKLYAMDRSFCLLSLDGTERLFSKDVDMLILSATMEYWIQTSKIQLLEDLIDNCNLATCGLRIPVAFGEETRQAVIVFNQLQTTDIQTGTICGEMAVCEVEVNILLYPDVTSYSDYTVAFSWLEDETTKTATMPLSSLSVVNTMTQKSVPFVNSPQNVGNINLSRSKSYVLVFDGYNNEFINFIAGLSLGGSEDNNQSLLMTIKRKETEYTQDVIIKDHQITVNADTGNETHTLSLVVRGI
jgi:hypothetical protein